MRLKDEKKIALIYEATLACVSSVGIDSITMSVIAKKASIATGTLYIYFPNKNALLNELYHEVKQKALSQLSIRELSWNFTQKFETFRKKIFLYKKNHVKEYLFLQLFSQSKNLSQKNRDLSTTFHQWLDDLIEEWKQTGYFGFIEKKLIINMINTIIDTMVDYANTTNQDLQTLIQQWIAMTKKALQ